MKWLRGLNALRLYAIVLIVTYHLLRDFMPGGFIAVEIFFCISGFLLSSKLLKEHSEKGEIKYFNFVRTRFLRLFIPLLTSVALVLGVMLFLDDSAFAAIRTRTLVALSFTTNIYELITGGDYENAISPNVFEHTWFLALEMQFCILLPLLAKLVLGSISGRRGQKMYGGVLLTLAIFSYLLMLAHGVYLGQYNRAYFAIDSHLFGFCLGAAYAVFNFLVPRTPRTLKSIPAAMMTLSLLTISILSFKLSFDAPMTYIFGLPFTAFLSAVMIACIIKMQSNEDSKRRPSPLVRILDTLGSLSFGIYLIHWPLVVLWPQIIDGELPEYLIVVISVVFALILKLINFDKLFNSRKVSARRVAMLAASLLAIFVVFAGYRLPNTSRIMDEILAEKDNATREFTAVDFSSVNDFKQITDTYIGKRYRDSNEDSDLSFSRPASPNDAKVFIIGDSVTLGAKNRLESIIEGAYVDAEESRGIEKAIPILADCASHGVMPNTVVISLITNERTITDELLDTILGLTGGSSNLVLVTGYAGPQQPREEQNAAIKSYANSHSGVSVVDWWALSHNNWSLLYADHIHLNPDGQYAYANLINNEIKRLNQ